jgi:hypothetical protein
MRTLLRDRGDGRGYATRIVGPSPRAGGSAGNPGRRTTEFAGRTRLRHRSFIGGT